jgi:hypothetical protein
LYYLTSRKGLFFFDSFSILDFFCHGSGAVGFWMICASIRETFVSILGAFALNWSWNTPGAESNWKSDEFTTCMHAILIMLIVAG